MTYTDEITLDFNAVINFPIITAKQNDTNSRILLIHFLQNGEEVKLDPDLLTIGFRVRKPDHHVILDSGSINTDGTAVITLTQQCLAVAGRAYADIYIHENSRLLSTASFIINIVASPDVMTSAAISSDEFGYLMHFIDDADDLIRESQAWAIGKRGSKEVEPGEEQYHNNSEYWSHQSNAWANGQTSGTPTFTNNAKYWSEEADRLGREWAQEADYRGEQWAEGTRNGQPVPAYSNKNAKYWSQQAEISRQKIEDLTVSAKQGAVGSDPRVKKTEEGGVSHLEFTIPKSDSAYVTFDIDYETGMLYMWRPDSGHLADEIDFSLNNNGELQITVNIDTIDT